MKADEKKKKIAFIAAGSVSSGDTKKTT